MPGSKNDLLKRDAKGNIGEKLLQAIRDVKASKHGEKHKVKTNGAIAARVKQSRAQ